MGPALPGLNITATRVESLPPGIERPVQGGGTVKHWAEVLEGGADVALQMANETPLLVSADGLHYLGGWPDEALWDRIVLMLTAKAGIETLELPSGVRVRDTATHRFYFNYGPEAVEVNGEILASADVRWHSLSDG